jgi:hypothetical protein
MKIHSIPVTKAQLDKIPEIERAFYVHIGHLRNELVVLKKLLDRAANNLQDNPILRDVYVLQSSIISRLLAGKLWEGWKLLGKAYFSPKLDLLIENNLPEDAQDSLRNLKGYFEKKNVIPGLRNKFAFHYDHQRVRTQLSLIKETDNWKIYVAETGDTFFQVSEIIVGTAMLEAVQPGDFVAATEKFFKEIMGMSGQLVNFCDGCLHYMIETYIEYQAEEIEISDPPNCGDLRLPFFCK